MPDRLSSALMALAVLALGGCAADPVPPVAPAPTVGVSTPAPATANPSPTADSPKPTADRPTPSPTSAAAGSTTYANDLQVSESGTVGYIPLRWYAGKKAEARCREKGISSPTAWCHDYYFEQAGAAASATLPADASITLLDDDARPKTATADQFRRAVQDETWPNFRLQLAGDQIRRVEQVYTP